MSKKSLNEARREFDKACDDHIERYGRNARVYISGPMSGLTRKEYLRNFREAEKELRAKDYTRIVNPIHVWACRWPWLYRIVGYRLTLLYDLWLLTRCDLIYKIPGWQESRGANIESCVAYHFKIWPVPKSDIAKLDKKLAKLQEKYGIKITH